MQNDLISIIVPVYKVEKYIHRCIESLINQTYQNVEILLIDDGSPDDSGSICDEYAKKDERIKVIHKENGGVSSTRNVGLQNANGNYISFVDSDDWIELDMYEKMLKQLKENHVDAVKCGAYRDDTVNPIEMPYIYSDSQKLDLKKERDNLLKIFLTGKADAEIWCMLIRRELIIDELTFKTDIAIGEDLLFLVELLCKIDTIYLYNERFYHYYINTNSATISPIYRKRNVNNFISLYKEMCEILKKYGILDDEKKEAFSFYCFYYLYYNLAPVVANEKKVDIIIEVFENKKLEFLLSGLNVANLSLIGKMFYYSMKNKMKNMMYYLCIIFDLLKNGKKNIINL